MLQRFSQLIAAATALMIIAAPAAQASERHGRGGGYYDRDGSRQVQRHRGYRAERKGWRRHARRGDYRRHRYTPRRRYYRGHDYARYRGPRFFWGPRYRHRGYRGRRYSPYYSLAILFSVLETERTGYTRRWSDPDTRTSGTITPTRTWRLASGQYCREYQQRIVIDGRSQDGFGRACRQPDGSWKTVD